MNNADPIINLAAESYTQFAADAPHLRKLKWRGDDAIVTFKDGTKYKVALTHGRDRLNLEQWKNICEDIDRMLIGKGILAGNVQSPAECQHLHSLLINKTGITYQGTTYDHTDTTNGRTDTKERYRNMKQYAKEIALAPQNNPQVQNGQNPPPQIQNGQNPPPQVGAPGAQVQHLPAMAGIDGVEPALMQQISNQIDIGSGIERQRSNGNVRIYLDQHNKLVNWSGLAHALTENNLKANDVYNQFVGQIPNDKRDEVRAAITQRFIDVAHNISREGLNNTVDDTIRAQPQWANAAQRPNLVGQVLPIAQTVNGTFQPALGQVTNEAARNQISGDLLAPANLTQCVTTRLQLLLDEEQRRANAPRQPFRLPGAGIFNGISNVVNRVPLGGLANNMARGAWGMIRGPLGL